MIGGRRLSATLRICRLDLEWHVAELPAVQAMPLSASRRDLDLEPYAVDAGEGKLWRIGHQSSIWFTRLNVTT